MENSSKQWKNREKHIAVWAAAVPFQQTCNERIVGLILEHGQVGTLKIAFPLGKEPRQGMRQFKLFVTEKERQWNLGMCRTKRTRTGNSRPKSIRADIRAVLQKCGEWKVGGGRKEGRKGRTELDEGNVETALLNHRIRVELHQQRVPLACDGNGIV